MSCKPDYYPLEDRDWRQYKILWFGWLSTMEGFILKPHIDSENATNPKADIN